MIEGRGENRRCYMHRRQICEEQCDASLSNQARVYPSSYDLSGQVAVKAVYKIMKCWRRCKKPAAKAPSLARKRVAGDLPAAFPRIKDLSLSLAPVDAFIQIQPRRNAKRAKSLKASKRIFQLRSIINHVSHS